MKISWYLILSRHQIKHILFHPSIHSHLIHKKKKKHIFFACFQITTNRLERKSRCCVEECRSYCLLLLLLLVNSKRIRAFFFSWHLLYSAPFFFIYNAKIFDLIHIWFFICICKKHVCVFFILVSYRLITTKTTTTTITKGEGIKKVQYV